MRNISIWHLSCTYKISNYFSFKFPLGSIANNGIFQKKIQQKTISASGKTAFSTKRYEKTLQFLVNISYVTDKTYGIRHTEIKINKNLVQLSTMIMLI